jgi:dienelactone hydrolase
LERIILNASVQTPWPCNNTVPALVGMPSGQPKAGIVLLHGYTGGKEMMAQEARGLTEWGYAVIMPDLPLHGERALGPDGMFEYPFYGDPGGVLKAFENALSDVRTCADYLRVTLGPEVPLGITGFSLGGCLTILSMARMPELFAAGVSVVGAAKLARLLLESTICGDIQADLMELGVEEEELKQVLKPVEATEYAENVHNLLLLGGSEDRIVPAYLVRETYAAIEHETNRCVIFERCSHFPSVRQVAEQALPFFEQRFSAANGAAR